MSRMYKASRQKTAIFQKLKYFRVLNKHTGLSLGFLIHGCQTLTVLPKADLKLHFLGDFSNFYFTSTGSKRHGLKSMGAMAPVAPVLTGPLSFSKI